MKVPDFSKASPAAGRGKWPECDPDGRAFSHSYFPKWFERRNKFLANTWRGVLDGVQGDQSWLHDTFNLRRAMAEHMVLTCAAFFLGELSTIIMSKVHGTMGGNIVAPTARQFLSAMLMMMRECFILHSALLRNTAKRALPWNNMGFKRLTKNVFLLIV